MRHLKFAIVGAFDGLAEDIIVNALFIPGSQTLNLHREPIAGLDIESWTDPARGWGYDRWTDRTVMDMIGRTYGEFRSVPVHNSGASPLPVY